MKQFTLLFGLTMLFARIALAQVTTPFNFPGGGGVDYVGWDLPTNLPLEIKNEATQPINFYTSGNLFGIPGTFNNMRMSIFEGTMVAPDGSNHNVGRVGITVYIHQ